MAFYASRRKLRPMEHDESGGELNIIPYLDIMMNLIMFMLLSITGFAVLGMLNVTSPSYNDAPVATSTPDKPDKPPLLLTVGLAHCGFFIAATGAVVAGTGGDKNACSIPKTPDSKYDFPALNKRMMEIKAAFPQESRVIIVADSDIEYGDLVRTMDATRETGAHQLLFNDVSLGQM